MRAPPPSSWHRFARCGSTNDEAQRLARAGAKEGTVVVAAEQTSGRGRLGRRWHSPDEKNLYLSVVLRPKLVPQQAPLLCLCAGLAMHHAGRTLVEELARERGTEPSAAPRLRLKWPNDLLAAGPQKDAPLRKLGGVLTELVCAGMHIDFVIIGVGCNVGGTQFPGGVDATSLALLTGETRDAAALVDRLGSLFLIALADSYDRYLRDGARPIIESFTRAAELGPQHPPVIVKTAEPGQGTIQGIPVGLGADGELLLEVASGARIAVLTGDVALTSALPFSVAASV